MKIVVLDGYALNPGDISWAELQSLGECGIYDRSAAEEVVARASGAEAALTNKCVLSDAVLKQLPGLRYIGVLATGYNIVDLPAASRRGIAVTNVPAYGTDSVAQMAMAHLLHLCERVGEHSQGVRAGRWSKNPDWCYWEHPLVELAGLTMGIVGLGRIGCGVARRAAAMGMKCLAYDLNPPPQLPEGVTMTDLDTLFAQSDVVSLHCPLTPQTQSLVNPQRLQQMKPTAFLINTSRGPLVDEQALADALNAGQIAGAGLDVLSEEPPQPSNPLLSAKNCHITPHIAWATRSARQRLMAIAVGNLRAFLEGKPVNIVNERKG
jgi:glycerate dehydrogenase